MDYVVFILSPAGYHRGRKRELQGGPKTYLYTMTRKFVIGRATDFRDEEKYFLPDPEVIQDHMDWGLGILPGVHSAIVLSQTNNEVRKPGESLRLTCQGSGQDSDGDTVTAYDLSWIRQEPGKSLEWLAEINPSSSTINYASSIKGRFTISRDNSKQALYLDMNSLKTEDTATYYCVVDTMRKFML
ncbi:HV348 protein, partial [Polypterus senegalus]